ncbi:MAG: YfhO family protein [Sphingobacteriales bacterium JAD_PAG50586_3]|nr:MAG: YfhO family protein [Sphingobacteriales bacterium JAD_PAG50586_3]
MVNTPPVANQNLQYLVQTKAADSTSAEKNNQTGGLPRDYITQWSVGVSETFTLLIPNYKGGETEAIGTDNKSALKDVKPAYKKQIAQSNAYYGDQPFTAGPTYAGAIIVFLFVLGLMFVSGPFKWAMLVATILSITFSWGGNWPGLFNFAVDYIPGYNKFRSVSMMLTVANFTLPLLGLFGLYKVLTTPDFLNTKMVLFGKETNFKNLHGFIVVFAVTGGLCLLMYLTPTTFNTFLSAAEVAQFTDMGNQAAASGNQQYTDQILDYQDSLETARITIFKADAIRSFLFIIAAAGLLFAYFKFTFDKRIVIAAVGVLILGDIIMVDQRFLNAKSFTAKKELQVPFPKNNAINSILTDNTPGKRTLNLAGSFTQDASVSYYTSSIGGYHGAKLKRYQQLIDFRIDGEIDMIRKTLSGGGLNDSIIDAMYRGTPTLNMLNTKYIIVNPNYPALSNPYAFGPAWFVKDLQLVENPDAEILALNKIDPKQTAVVDKAFEAQMAGFKPSFDSAATIKLASYQPNHLVYESNTATDQLAVFSEIYYKNGWNVYVDGKATDYVRANFVLRAMKVHAGKHKIEFKFEPAEYKKGEGVALAGSIILFLALAGALFLELRRKKEEEPAA